MIRMPVWAVELGKTIGVFYNPMNVTLGIEMFFVFLFFYPDESVKEFLRKVHTMMILPLCTVVGFYCIFKQSRPCRIKKTKKLIGTAYGMPSGDAMFGAIIAYQLWGINKILSLVSVVSICFSRIARGYHSLLQVCVGTFFGVGFSFLRDLMGDWFYPLNWALGFILPGLVFFDPKLVNKEPYDFFNLQVWFFTDLSYPVFDLVYCSPFNHVLSEGKRLFLAWIFTFTTHIFSYIIGERGFSLCFCK